MEALHMNGKVYGCVPFSFAPPSAVRQDIRPDRTAMFTTDSVLLFAYEIVNARLFVQRMPQSGAGRGSTYCAPVNMQ